MTRKQKNYKLRKKLTPYLFLLPALVFFGAYLIYPAIYALVMSFFDWGATVETQFIGLQNFTHMFSDKLFYTSIINTLIYVCAVPFKVVLAMVLAALLNQNIKGEGFFRATLFFPFVLSEVIVGVIWKAMFNPTYGFINTALSWFGLEGQNWLATDKAMWVIILVSVWKGLGSNLIIYIAGIKGISTDFYEAAAIDGASELQKFWYITLPCLKPTTIFVVLLYCDISY